MGDKTGIQWTDATWNPVTGCSKVSQGCKFCYAERDFRRPYGRDVVTMPGSHTVLGPAGPFEVPNIRPRKFTDVFTHPNRLDQPLRWKTPRRVFVNSMSDLFHEDVPFEFIASVFAVMGVTTRHTYQILTKRPERMLEFFRWALQAQDEDGTWYPLKETDFAAGDRIFDHWPKHIEWKGALQNRGSGYDNCGPLFPYENVWLGVSCEDQATADERIPLLLQTPAAVRFVSAEPLLERVRLDSYLGACNCRVQAEDGAGIHASHCRATKPRIDWVIVGGESGPKARPCDADWIRDIVIDCQRAEVPCFVKQLGANWILAGFDIHGPLLRDRKGGDPDEWPADLRVREFPDA